MPLPEATALVILVPESEPLVQSFRQRYDPVAAVGMPAHITLLYPFKHGDQVNDMLLDELKLLFGSSAPFHFSLVDARRFPGVLYLTPEPAPRFKELTRAIVERYPETPPYGGAFSDTFPHLTVAHGACEEELYRIERELCRASSGVLPIQAYAGEVWLVEKREGRWHRHTSFPLGGR
jgi:2'-5' RNA ligase